MINAVLGHFMTGKERERHAGSNRRAKKKKKTYKDGSKSHSDRFAD